MFASFYEHSTLGIWSNPVGIALPILPRQIHPIHRLPMVRNRRFPRPFLPPHSHGPRLVHRYFSPFISILSLPPTPCSLLSLSHTWASITPQTQTPPQSPSNLTFPPNSMLHPRNLPPKPIPRLPPTEIRPLPLPRRRPRGRRTHRPTHETRRRIPALHTPPARVQVLAFEY